MDQLQPGAAGGQLAVGPVDARPRLEQLHDRGPLCLEQAVHRAAATGPIREPVGTGPLAPADDPIRVQAE